jgi:hypothetical protein
MTFLQRKQTKLTWVGARQLGVTAWLMCLTPRKLVR